MASRVAAKVTRKTKAVADSIVHPPFLKLIIPAQQARPAPPLGPQLGKADRSYDLVISHPSSMHLLRMAAAAKKGASSPGTEVCGRLSLKHIYHIAELKKQDPHLFTADLQDICKMLIGTAHRLGIEIVTQDDIESGKVDYTPSGYANFLQDREAYLKQKKLETETAKQSKMMRL
uniref:Large ribosomal subunit protein uL11m n=1 Tax=Schistosoma haematobium TaxID=6185 RepID=A0A095A4L5_SCHHA